MKAAGSAGHRARRPGCSGALATSGNARGEVVALGEGGECEFFGTKHYLAESSHSIKSPAKPRVRILKYQRLTFRVWLRGGQLA